MESPEYYLMLVIIRVARFVLIALFAWLFAVVSEGSLRQRRPVGVMVFAVLLCAASVDKLFGFRSFEYYQFMFQNLSDKMVIVRYIFSISLRVVGFVTAIGLLYLRDFYRKIALVLSGISLLTIYWKHPITVFQNIANLTQQHMPAGPPINPLWGLGIYVLIDVVFAIAMIRYLTRPHVKKFFQEY